VLPVHGGSPEAAGQVNTTVILVFILSSIVLVVPWIHESLGI